MTDKNPDPKAKPFSFTGSRTLASWLNSVKMSFAFTTYQTGRVFTVGVEKDGSLAISERAFARSMGLGKHDNGMWLASLYQLWRFDNFLEKGQIFRTSDALYVPTEAYTTGDVDIHDIGTMADGSPVFVVTRFNCLATLEPGKSFRPIWKPPFIDRLVAEDRCHLNGMAMKDGKPKYVTCVSKSNVLDGWREHRNDAGVVIDVDTNEIIADGLSMPHSPRIYNDEIWLIESGTGNFGKIDKDSGTFEPVGFLPGFARGFSIVGDYAFIGVSKPRESSNSFTGLRLNDRLEAEGIQARCMVGIVNLKTGASENFLEVHEPVTEIYDVQALPGVNRPSILGTHKQDIRHILNPAQTL